MKFVALPEDKTNASCGVLSIGIGGDITFEKKLKARLPQCTFVGECAKGDGKTPFSIGADPVEEVAAMYKDVGTYNAVAVGDSNGTQPSLVMISMNGTYIPTSVQSMHFLDYVCTCTVVVTRSL